MEDIGVYLDVCAPAGWVDENPVGPGENNATWTSFS
jgi:hypothetical protein